MGNQVIQARPTQMTSLLAILDKLILIKRRHFYITQQVDISILLVRKQLPDGFHWDFRFAKSHFNEDLDQMIFAGQIPNSYVGPGSEGKYGMFIDIAPLNSSEGPDYPNTGNTPSPSSYGSFSTAQSILEFQLSRQMLALGVISLPILLATWRKHRNDTSLS